VADWCDKEHYRLVWAVPSSIPRRRWRIAFLLGAGVVVNYFDRVNLSVAHSALIATFAISNITFGYLSAAYNWTYALCQLPVGVVLDRFGVRRVGRVSSFLWSVASFAASIAPNLGAFFAARLLLGIGEAPTFPGNAKAIGYWFPARERSSATSIFDGSAKFASAIGVPLIGILLLKFGWRWSFAATGLVSFLYFLLFCYIYRDPDEDPYLTQQERDYILEKDAAAPILPAETASLGYLIRQPKVIGITLGFGAYNYVFYLLLTWLPSYLSSALHIDLLHSFLYTGVPWLIGTASELLIGGWLVDRLLERGWNASRVQRVVLIGGTTMGLGIIGAAYSQTPASALSWISISLAGLSAASAVGWSVPSLIGPRGSVGTLAGIQNFSSQVSGIVAPIVTGYLVTARHSFGWAFGVAGIYLSIGISAYIFLLGRLEKIPSQIPSQGQRGA
jgi:ACS family D-galactonate transporter-like MFS transporter